jgi:hypothetical protein
MNLALKDIIEEELQKHLNSNFNYLISNSSPLVIMPKKNGKWRIYIYYRETKQSHAKGSFSIKHCIDQVLDTVLGKKLFSFLDRFSGYNHI